MLERLRRLDVGVFFADGWEAYAGIPRRYRLVRKRREKRKKKPQKRRKNAEDRLKTR
jgi:hypothetical protein